MSRFLFWNTGRRSIAELIARAAHTFRVDVLILAECSIPGVELLSTLNRVTSDYQLTFTVSPSITVLTRFHSAFLRPTTEGDRYSFRRLKLPGQQDLLIAIAHLPSGLYFSLDSRNHECIQLARLVADEESKIGHDRTLLVGDLNLNPFDASVASASGLHALMTRTLAARKSRIVQQREYPIFYNPMWRFFGQPPGRPSGTYYYERAEHVMYFWNIFDQILIRPSLVDGFEDTQLMIVDDVGGVSLTHADGRPNPMIGSDHLPVLFTLNIPLEDKHAGRDAQLLA